MVLSSELISQFVKITNDSKKKSKEATVYGTVKFVDEKPFVQLDGSSMLTPVTTTSTIREGNRVTVLIKNHSAIVTGNVTAPSASSEMLNDLASDLGIIGDDLDGMTTDFDLLVQSVSEINDDLVETGQHVVALETLTSGIKKTDSGVYTINGMEFGNNKVLWSGNRYMTTDQEITLPESISKQANGIVLVFSRYDPDTSSASNSDFNSHFVPKQMVISNNGNGHLFTTIAGADMALVGTKYLYISDTKIDGHDKNDDSGTSASGIKFSNNRFVLRYVIGV